MRLDELGYGWTYVTGLASEISAHPFATTQTTPRKRRTKRHWLKPKRHAAELTDQGKSEPMRTRTDPKNLVTG